MGSIEQSYDYSHGWILGTGQRSVVKCCNCKKTNNQFAVKALIKDKETDVAALQKEILMLKKLNHPNTLMLQDVIEEEDRLFLVTEVCVGGDLFAYIKQQHSKGKVSEREATDLVRQILVGVEYLHNTLHIAHRDLKPENILLKPDSKGHAIKIADFGDASIFTEKILMTECVGTLLYCAPEVLNKRYNQLCDIWSLGVVTYALLSGKAPFGGKTDKDVQQAIKKGQVAFSGPTWRCVSKNGKEFLWALLAVNVKKRLNASQALAHIWLSS